MRLPDFVIAGVAKAGTTSLYSYLGEHPQVFVSARKELNYFACGDPVVAQGWPHLPFPVKSWDDYVACFAEAGEDQVAGEASPIYFDSPQAVRRIAEQLPDAKVIISLRDPRERAFSGYLMHVREGHRELTDDEIVASRGRFIMGGFYFEKLRVFHELIGPERLKIVLFDDIARDVAAVMQDLHRFLGLDEQAASEFRRRHNAASYPKSHRLNAVLTSRFVKERVAPVVPSFARRAGRWLIGLNRGAAPRLSAGLRDRLGEIYREDVLQVEALIGRDLSAWLSGRD